MADKNKNKPSFSLKNLLFSIFQTWRSCISPTNSTPMMMIPCFSKTRSNLTSDSTFVIGGMRTSMTSWKKLSKSNDTCKLALCMSSRSKMSIQRTTLRPAPNWSLQLWQSSLITRFVQWRAIWSTCSTFILAVNISGNDQRRKSTAPTWTFGIATRELVRTCFTVSCHASPM